MIPVRILFNDTYSMHSPSSSDYLIVLRGKYRVNPKWKGFYTYKKRFAWCISWPSTYTSEELQAYDHLLIASKSHSKDLLDKLTITNISVLQCTAFREHNTIPEYKREGICFVGNTRNKTRPVVEKIFSLNIPVLLFGNGWDKIGKIAEAFSLPNDKLPTLYSSSTFSLNDHHCDMLEYGYVNNRVYDSIICGSRIISDHDPNLDHPLIADNVILVDDIISSPSKFFEDWIKYSQKSVSAETVDYISLYHSFDYAVTTFLSFM